MELLQLRYFLTVARTLNISRAAQYHMIPQPAMSQTISRLEKELGKSLFDRHKNKLTLTKDGEAFLHSVTTCINELDTAIQNLHCEENTLRGELKLLVRQHRGTLIDCIAEFRKQNPNVSFRIFHRLDPNDLDDYDLCISCTPIIDNQSESKPLITEKLQLVTAANHPLANEPFVPFETLKNEDFALLNKDNSLWNHTMHLCHQAGFDPKISMIGEDLHCLTKYVATGMAVTLGPELSWKTLKSDKIVFIPIVPEEIRTTYVFWNGSQTPSALKMAFLDFLVTYFSQMRIPN